MTKFHKTLFTINGLIIPCIILFVIYKNTSPLFKSNKNETGVMIGQQLDDAIIENEALQGLYYDTPDEIYNSNNFYLPISILTYKEARVLERKISSSNNVGYNEMQTSNIIFLDSNYKVINKLLEKKACITDLRIRGKYYTEKETIDKSYLHLTYQIAFDDSNGDGLLNNNDYQDLYITNLKGENLTKVTSGKDIMHFKYMNNNQKIFITYTDRNNTRKKEHRLKKFCVYDIESKVTTDIESLNNTLEELELQIINK
jgi:hypothetical protein